MTNETHKTAQELMAGHRRKNMPEPCKLCPCKGLCRPTLPANGLRKVHCNNAADLKIALFGRAP